MLVAASSRTVKIPCSVEHKSSVYRRAAKFVEHRRSPTALAVRRQLEDFRSLFRGGVSVDDAKDVPGGIHGQPCGAVAEAGISVDHPLHPVATGRAQFEGAVVPHTVEIARRVRDQPVGRIPAVGTILRRAEAVQDGFRPAFPRGTQFEHDARSIRAAFEGCAVEVSRTVDYHLRIIWTRPVRTILSRTEAIEDGLFPASLPVWRKLEYGSISEAAVVRRSKKVAGTVRSEAGLGVGAIAATLKVVKHLRRLGLGYANHQQQSRNHTQCQSTSDD